MVDRMSRRDLRLLLGIHLLPFEIISRPLVLQTDTFEISNHDGKITLNGPLDFENEQRYTLFVTAKVSRRML